MIQTIVEEGIDLTNLVEDLLVAARVDAGTLTVVHVPVDLRAQAAQVLEAGSQDATSHIQVVGTPLRPGAILLGSDKSSAT
jgi:signal transduction histidine kinase